MPEKKCIISIGQIDRYIIFALLGGISQCICSTMLYIFRDYANYNKHPLIIGFNAGIGMSFSFIPFLIVKINSHRTQKKNNQAFIQNLLRKETKNLKGITDAEYLKKFNKTKLRIQKYLILLACAVLDCSQKMIAFILNKFMITNLWIFNILFISIYEYCIMKRKLYKHQYLSCSIIIVLGIAATIIGLLEEEGNLFIKIIICASVEILFSLAYVLAKNLMDYRDCSPFEITFYEGIFSLIIHSILLTIFTNCPLPDNDKYDDIFRLTYYEGKKYLDHFFVVFKNMGIGESFLFILSACGRLFANLFGHIVVKHYTSSHVVLILILGEIFLVFKESTNWRNIVQFILFCFVLVMLLIFTEIIEINICDLEKNTRKNIYLRQLLEANGQNAKSILYSKNDDKEKIELNENLEIEMEGDIRSSLTSSDS